MRSPFNCNHSTRVEEDLQGEIVDVCKHCGLVMPRLAPEFQATEANESKSSEEVTSEHQTSKQASPALPERIEEILRSAGVSKGIHRLVGQNELSTTDTFTDAKEAILKEINTARIEECKRFLDIYESHKTYQTGTRNGVRVWEIKDRIKELTEGKEAHGK